MVEVERSTLLALMRRLRWRQRCMAGVDGAATAVCIAAVFLIVGVLIAPGRFGFALGRDEMGAVLLAALALGAARYAVRAVSLVDMARAVDRTLNISKTLNPMPSPSLQTRHAPPSDDCVLAAVTLLDAPAAITPFVRALAAQAARRAGTVSVKQVIAPPQWRRIALALLMTGILAVVASFWRQGARIHLPTEDSVAVRAAGTHSSLAAPVAVVSLESEQEDAARAARAAHETGDGELARLADRFRDLLAVISAGGSASSDLASHLDRLDAVIGEAAALSGEAARAERAAAAARAALNRGAGDGGKQAGERAALAAAIFDGSATGPTRAAQAAARLASSASGQAALASAARAATDALAGKNGQGQSGAMDDADRGRRRLGNGADQSAKNDVRGQPDGGEEPRRRLEHLRRELENAGGGCPQGVEGCGHAAEESGRALSELHRSGETAQARQRVADAARQLSERIRHEMGGGSQKNLEQLRSFAQAARGQGQRPDPKGASSSAAWDGNAGAGRGTADQSVNGGDKATDESSSTSGAAPAADSAAQPRVGSTSSSESPHGEGVAPRGGASADGETAAAAGMGTAPGGPVLGVRSESGHRSGRDIAVELSNDPRGGSRAEVINGAAVRGFASPHYGRVFSDYNAAMEESLDSADVPPGKRYLVRRYFQLIRPRTEP